VRDIPLAFSTSLLKAATPGGFFFAVQLPLTRFPKSKCKIAMKQSNITELIGCDLAWKRDGADWVFLHKRRRMGRVRPDSEHRGMYRVVLSRGRFSDMANLSWAKDAALAAAIRELEWEAKPRAIDPSKCPVKGGSLPATFSLSQFSEWAARVVALTQNANPESLTVGSSVTS
jgi:hypothetical protein